MKRILNLTIVFAVILMLVGCGDDVVLDAPDVDYTVTDEGATLSLDWILIADADGYYIYADGAVIDTVTTNAYDATIPAAVYGVAAYSGDDVSGTDDVDCTPVQTSNLNIWALSDTATDHPSGLSFTATGTGVAISVQSANYADLDYIFDDVGMPLTLMSPNAYTPVFNDEKNMSLEATGTDFDAIEIADAPGNYSTQTPLQENAVYALFMDQDDDGWDTDSDHFGKMKVESIAGTAITITVAYQTITGLRWLVTD